MRTRKRLSTCGTIQSRTRIKDKTRKGSSRCASPIRKVLKLTRYPIVVVIAVVLEYGLLSVKRRPKLITVEFDVKHQNKRKYKSFVVSLNFLTQFLAKQH